MVNGKNQEKIKAQTKACENAIKDTIACLSSEGEIDSGLFHSLLDAKDALSKYCKANGVYENYLW
ncbi:hypothetical protein ACRQV7_03030 [Caproiciproducens sp. R2]|uniref:hypothetical protein n=1 Tax=Caproiciproducens sp. R2 TaxID=3435187 RepID=UPI0040343016